MIDALRRLMSTITQPLTVAEYERRIAAGIIGEDDPVELIEGGIVPKMPKGPRHVMAAKACQRLLGHLLGAGWHVAKGDPVRIPDQDEPEPDVAVARGAATDYPDHHPGPGDIPLKLGVSALFVRQKGKSRRRFVVACSARVYSNVLPWLGG